MPDPISPERKWQVKMVRSGLPGIKNLPDRLGMPDLGRLSWLFNAIRPADVGVGLREAMLNRDNMLEDVNYQKVIPNRFVIQVSQDNYYRQYRPIEQNIIEQWRGKLLEDLITANSRQGRKEFRLGGRLSLEVKPSGDLKDYEARILCRIEPEAPDVARERRQVQPEAKPRNFPAPSPVKPAVTQGPAGPGAGAAGQDNRIDPSVRAPLTTAYLEMVPEGEWWTLYTGINTIGRSEICQIFLNQPIVQEKRLVSGQHAYIVMQNGACILYDGSPDGRPSANGTYVNLRRIPPEGYRLQHGDAILLASVNPQNPRTDTPGVVNLNYWTQRKD